MPTTASTRRAHSSGLSRWLERALERIDRPGWRKFALSMVALGLAFLLAVYSTIFAQQGRIIATAFCALSALGLAAWTAVTAIPYLARRTQIEWLQVSLDYKVTREGWVFIMLILLLAAAGLNTGNNLLYLILASMLAALLVSGILSLAVLNGVQIGLDIPDQVFARRPVDAMVRLENLKRLFPSFSLTLAGTPHAGSDAESAGGVPRAAWREVLPRATLLVLISWILPTITFLVMWKVSSDFYGMRIRSLIAAGVLTLLGSFALALVSLAYRERKRRERLATPRGLRQGILGYPLYFPFLARGATVRRKVELEFPRRGYYKESGLDLSTRFPFGFLEKTMHVGITRELLVYPAVKPTRRFFEILSLLTGEVEAYQRGTGHDLYAIREMLSSDSVRHVDWKASARAGAMMVREFAREDDRRVQLVLDARVGRSPLPEALAQFEAGVEFCASLAWHFHELGAQFQFICGDYRTRVAPAGEIIYDVLERLATVQADESAPDRPHGSGTAEGDDERAFRIICTGAPREHLQGSQPAHTHFVFFDSLTGVQ